MTSELEQKFFSVFGIEPTVYSLWDSKETQIKNFNSFTVYPEITDRRLLELICIFHKYIDCGLYALTVQSLKDEILTRLMQGENINEYKEHIQQLFKEEE